MAQSNKVFRERGAKEADIDEHFDRHMSQGMYEMRIDTRDGWSAD